MEEVHDKNLLPGSPVYYMSHHMVICKDHETTKVCTIFDISFRGTGMNSMNGLFNGGPNVNPDIIQLLFNFRPARIGIIADTKVFYVFF